MNNIRLYAITVSITFLAGFFVWCIMNGFIIIQIPRSTNHFNTHIHTSKENKTIKFFFWHNHRWHRETDTLVSSSDLQENIKIILSYWLNLLHEEQSIPLNSAIQSVLVSNNETIAAISFSINPFNYNAPTIESLLFIKGLFKTLKENNIPIQAIMLMENHKPLEHPQLDFTKPWPLSSLDHLISIH